MKRIVVFSLAAVTFSVFCALVHADILNQVKALLHEKIPLFLNDEQMPLASEATCTLIETLLQGLEGQLILYDNEPIDYESLGVFLHLTQAGQIAAQIHLDSEDIAFAQVQLPVIQCH